MDWTPVLGIVMGLLVGFDAYRAFDTNGFWGQPWPRLSRNDNAPLFWGMQTLRIIASAGLIVVGALWLSQELTQ